jgi:hypothetical protein
MELVKNEDDELSKIVNEIRRMGRNDVINNNVDII